jgi:hypothetical protein
LTTKLGNVAEKLNARSPQSYNDYVREFVMHAGKKRLNPVVKQTMKNTGKYKDLVEKDDMIEHILKVISDGTGGSVDFSKMSAKDIVRLIKQN